MSENGIIIRESGLINNYNQLNLYANKHATQDNLMLFIHNKIDFADML